MVRAAVIFSVALASKPIAEPDPDLRDVIARLEASREADKARMEARIKDLEDRLERSEETSPERNL